VNLDLSAESSPPLATQTTGPTQTVSPTQEASTDDGATNPIQPFSTATNVKNPDLTIDGPTKQISTVSAAASTQQGLPTLTVEGTSSPEDDLITPQSESTLKASPGIELTGADSRGARTSRSSSTTQLLLAAAIGVVLYCAAAWLLTRKK
jgi:hypothetical protein